MKKLLIVSLLLLSVGLSQNRVNVNNLVNYGDKYFKENDDRPFDGLVFDLSKKTGNKILEFRMVNGLKNGLYQEWYTDGKPKSKGKYLNEIKDDKWTWWYENGQKLKEETYKGGKEDRSWTTWYKNGQKKFEGISKDGKRDGLWTDWDENGKKLKEETYKDGELISKKEWNEDGSVIE